MPSSTAMMPISNSTAVRTRSVPMDSSTPKPTITAAGTMERTRLARMTGVSENPVIQANSANETSSSGSAAT